MKKKNRAHRPFPEELVITRREAGTPDEFLLADLTREDASGNLVDQREQRIAVYRLEKVLLPGIAYHEVENDDGK